MSLECIFSHFVFKVLDTVFFIQAGTRHLIQFVVYIYIYIYIFVCVTVFLHLVLLVLLDWLMKFISMHRSSPAYLVLYKRSEYQIFFCCIHHKPFQ